MAAVVSVSSPKLAAAKAPSLKFSVEQNAQSAASNDGTTKPFPQIPSL